MENPERNINIQDALKKYGIEGKHLYLLDMIPLIEIAWADGIVQDMEKRLMKEFLEKHIKNINEKAGSTVLTYEVGYSFLDRFLKERPHPEVMKILRSLVVPLRFANPDKAKDYEQKINILKFCMDIAASCVKHYPYGDHERFTEEEKIVFLEIMRSLGISPDRMI